MVLSKISKVGILRDTSRKKVGFPQCKQGLEESEHEVNENLGPVVQSIVSLTSPLRGQLVKCFTTL